MLQKLPHKTTLCALPFQMQLFVLYVPERLAADVASMLRLVVDENMFRNVRPLAAPAVHKLSEKYKS